MGSGLRQALAVAAFALGGLLVGADGAWAADLGPDTETRQPPADPASGWQFRFTPYGWMTGVNGNATVRGHRAEINASFFDIVQKSDSLIAFTGYFEARKGKLGLFTDVVWQDLGFPGKIDIQRDPLSALNISIRGKAQLTYQSTIIQSGMAYEVARWPGASAAQFTAVDVLGGARYWRQNVDLDLNLNGTATLNLPNGLRLQRSGSRAIARSGDLEWVDPFTGARIRHQLAPGKELMLEGDVGGFGVGSDFSWQVVGTYGFDTTVLGMPMHAVVGYRALAVDYSETGAHGKSGVDFVEHGPVIGASFSW